MYWALSLLRPGIGSAASPFLYLNLALRGSPLDSAASERTLQAISRSSGATPASASASVAGAALRADLRVGTAGSALAVPLPLSALVFGGIVEV